MQNLSHSELHQQDAGTEDAKPKIFRRCKIKVQEILEIEGQRESDNLESVWKMNVFHEGNFLRLYQRSAWIMTLEKPKINTMVNYNRQLKKKIISVGFPYDRLASWLPENFTVKEIDENRFEFIPSAEYLEKSLQLEESLKKYSEWFESKFKDIKKTKRSDSNFEDLWLRVLTFQIEKQTPMDCVSFIEELKTEIAKRITSEDVNG